MTRRKPTQRELLITDLATVVDELFDRYRTHELVPGTAIPSLARDAANGQRIPAKTQHVNVDDGLLVQLAHAAGVRPTRDEYNEPRSTLWLLEPGPARGTRYGADTGGHTKPGSRPPMSLDALDTLTHITSGITTLRREADKAAGASARLVAMRRTPRDEFRHMTWLLTTARDGQPLLTDTWARRIYRSACAWHADARVALSYLAPVATLQVPCPECGGELKVRADATSDVWCAGAWTVEGPPLEGRSWPVTYPHRATWPRITWIDLLNAKGSA